MLFRHLIALVFVSMALAACSRPTETIIPSDVAKWDTELAPSMKNLDEADRLKVASYLMRAKAGEIFGGKGVPTGTTIGDAIKDQDKWEAGQAEIIAKEEALKKKLDAERAATLDKLSKAVTVTLLSKREVGKNYDAGRFSDYQEFNIGVQNNSAQPIIGVAGEIKFVDIFDKEVGSVNFRISEKIEPGKTAKWSGGRDYNQFIDSHKAVWNLEDGKYKTKFVPETIVYADNSKLTVEE